MTRNVVRYSCFLWLVFLTLFLTHSESKKVNRCVAEQISNNRKIASLWTSKHLFSVFLIFEIFNENVLVDQTHQLVNQIPLCGYQLGRLPNDNQ
jgi:lysophospholipid acyltransferase (LPLAT)-like uncharacterized protein